MSIDTSKGIAGLKGALRYVRAYRDNVFVIKLGGEVLADQEALDRVAAQIGLLTSLSIRIVVVHGGVIGTIMNLATGSTGFSFTGADNASISHLVITPERWIVRCYNDTTHLRSRFSTIDEPPPASGIRPTGITF